MRSSSQAIIHCRTRQTTLCVLTDEPSYIRRVVLRQWSTPTQNTKNSFLPILSPPSTATIEYHIMSSSPAINKAVPQAKEFYPLNEPAIGTPTSNVRLIPHTIFDCLRNLRLPCHSGCSITSTFQTLNFEGYYIQEQDLCRKS